MNAIFLLKRRSKLREKIHAILQYRRDHWAGFVFVCKEEEEEEEEKEGHARESTCTVLHVKSQSSPLENPRSVVSHTHANIFGTANRAGFCHGVYLPVLLLYICGELTNH